MALASMPQLQTLTLLHCDAGDILCQELSKSKSLLHLRTGTYLPDAENCGVTEEGVMQITKIKQLKELALGNPPDYPD